jgi:hypothetical protein
MESGQVLESKRKILITRIASSSYFLSSKLRKLRNYKRIRIIIAVIVRGIELIIAKAGQTSEECVQVFLVSLAVTVLHAKNTALI